MNEGDQASAFDEPSAPIHVHISDLPDAINMATYERGRHVLIVDNAEGMASRFLRYQRGCYLLFHNQDDITPESLRKNLVGALKFGSFFVLSFDELPCASVDQLFTDDACFPQAAMRRTEVFKKETWGPLLRPDEGVLTSSPSNQSFGNYERAVVHFMILFIELLSNFSWRLCMYSI